MRFAYADPPYLGLAEKFYGKLHPEAAAYDKLETHAALVARLVAEFPDGWAMSLHSPSLRQILPLCPDGVRVMAWVKPWTPWKPGIRVAYAWEPLIVWGGRKRTKLTVRDWCRASSDTNAPQKFRGCKPETFCHWVFDVLGVQDGDEVIDLFPGAGTVARAWQSWRDMDRLWRPRQVSSATPLPFEADEAPHEWVPANSTIAWGHCCKCGIVRRTDGKNSPACKGTPRVGPRTAVAEESA